MEEAIDRARSDEPDRIMPGAWDFHRALFEEAPYGVLVQDAAERILAANPVARRMLALREGGDLAGLRLLGADGAPLLPEAFPAHACLSTGAAVKDVLLGIVDPAGGPALWVNACAVPQFRPGESRPFQVQTTLQDITFRKRTEDALRQSEQRFATIFQACPVGIDIIRLADERFVDVNDAWLEFMGLERAEVIGRTSEELGLYTHPEERRRIFDSLHRGTRRERSETTFISRTKGLRAVVFSLQTVSLLGEPHVITLTEDITASKAAEAEIKSQLNFVNTLLDTLPVPTFIKDPKGHYVRCNPAFLEMHGLSEEEVIGRTVAEITTPERIGEHEFRDRQLLAAPGVQKYEGQACRKDGSLRDVLFHKASYLDAQGAVAGIVGSLLDITDLKRTEEALRESERRVRAKLEAILSPEGDLGVLALEDIIDLASVGALLEEFSHLAHTAIALTDLQGRVVLKAGWQEACARFHLAHPEAAGSCMESGLALTAGLQPGQSRQRQCWNRMWNMATPIVVGGKHLGDLMIGQFFLAEEAPDPAFFEAQARRYGFDADAYLAAMASVPRLKQEDADRAMRCCTGFANTVSSLSYSTLKLTRAAEERTRAQEALQKSERFLREAQTAGCVGCFVLDITLGIWESSETFDAMFGIGPDHPRDVPGWLELAAPESRGTYQAYMLELIQTQGQRRFDIEFPARRKRDGQERWIYGQGSVEFDAQGQTATLIGTMLDITERKAAEQERAKLHEQLNQVQKLESVGRLAGGVAHDSNNMLMAILMHADLLHEQLGPDSPA
ncbi:MAG TPA: PAS domain S-box protein, partial [Holophaga sp.]|nr:PAS domain S-box protein [Holophaga sp.]